jgi:hypothetical protein
MLVAHCVGDCVRLRCCVADCVDDCVDNCVADRLTHCFANRVYDFVDSVLMIVLINTS